MENIKNEFNNRVNEINRYFDFLAQIESEKIKIHTQNTVKNVEILLPPTLRASAILLLYNLMEATVILAIDYIHITISTELNLMYKDANEALKKIWIEYQYDNFKGTQKGSEQIFSDLKRMENEKINIFIANAKDKKEYLTKIKGVAFTGKIDAQQVKKFATKYGFKPNRRVEGKNLLQIKTQRNNLAHGELSFNESGNNYSFQKLVKLKKETVLFLTEFLNNIELYITEEQYKI